jgi:hypothetical protein
MIMGGRRGAKALMVLNQDNVSERSKSLMVLNQDNVSERSKSFDGSKSG